MEGFIKNLKRRLKFLTTKEKLFCEFYISYQNLTEAAIKAGYKKSSAQKKARKLIGKPEIQNEIKKLKKEIDNNQLTHWAIIILKRIMFCSPNDTICLALKQNDLTNQQIEKLNLFQISELKKLKDGTLEIKFIDKIKAIACLMEIANGLKNSDTANNLLSALQTNSNEVINSSFDEHETV